MVRFVTSSNPNGYLLETKVYGEKSWGFPHLFGAVYPKGPYPTRGVLTAKGRLLVSISKRIQPGRGKRMADRKIGFLTNAINY